MRLDLADAVKLTELLGFLIGWTRSGPVQLRASLLRYIGHPAYGTADLRADLARLQFLLGGVQTALCGPGDT